MQASNIEAGKARQLKVFLPVLENVSSGQKGLLEEASSEPSLTRAGQGL